MGMAFFFYSVLYINAEVPPKTCGELVARHRAAGGPQLLATPSKGVWSVEPVRPKQHRDHDDNQQGAADPPPRHRHQPELVKVPRSLSVAIICPMESARIRAWPCSRKRKPAFALSRSHVHGAPFRLTQGFWPRSRLAYGLRCTMGKHESGHG